MKSFSRKTRAFTLIELLTVIAIIAILAGIVLGTAGLATEKMRLSRLKSEHARLVTAIDAYKAKMGNYPPDGFRQPQRAADPQEDYHIKAGRNPLFYELSGAIYDPAEGGKFTTLNMQDAVKAAELKTALGVTGIENSVKNDPARTANEVKRGIPFRGVTFKASQFDDIDGFEDVDILIVPLAGPHDKHFPKKGGKTLLNPWFYDSSTTNRHNLDTYDLWTEYKGRNGTVVIGNWRD